MKTKIVFAFSLLLLLFNGCQTEKETAFVNYKEENYDQIPLEKLQDIAAFNEGLNKPVAPVVLNEHELQPLLKLVDYCQKKHEDFDVSFLGELSQADSTHPSFFKRLAGYNRIDYWIETGNTRKLISEIAKSTGDRSLAVNANQINTLLYINRTAVLELLQKNTDAKEVKEKLQARTEQFHSLLEKAHVFAGFFNKAPDMVIFFWPETGKDFSRLYSKFYTVLNSLLAGEKFGTHPAILQDADFDQMDALLKTMASGFSSNILIKDGDLAELIRVRKVQATINFSGGYTSPEYADINRKKGDKVWLRMYFGEGTLAEVNKKGSVRKITGYLTAVNDRSADQGYTAPQIQSLGVGPGKETMDSLNRVLKKGELPIPLGINITNLTISKNKSSGVFEFSDPSVSAGIEQFTDKGFSTINYDKEKQAFADNYITNLFPDLTVKRTFIDFSNWDVSFITSRALPSFYKDLQNTAKQKDVVLSLADLKQAKHNGNVVGMLTEVVEKKFDKWNQDNKNDIEQLLQKQVAGAKVTDFKFNPAQPLTGGQITAVITLNGKPEEVKFNYGIDKDKVIFAANAKKELSGAIQGEIQKEVGKLVEKTQTTIKAETAKVVGNVIAQKSDLEVVWDPVKGVSLIHGGQEVPFTPQSLEKGVKEIVEQLPPTELKNIVDVIEKPNPGIEACNRLVGRKEFSFFGLDFKIDGVKDCAQGIFTASCTSNAQVEVTVKFSGDNFVAVVDYQVDQVKAEIEKIINDNLPGKPYVQLSNIHFERGKLVGDITVRLQDLGLDELSIPSITIDENAAGSVLKALQNTIKETLKNKLNEYLAAHLSNIKIANVDNLAEVRFVKFSLAELGTQITFAVEGAIEFKDLGMVSIPFTYTLGKVPNVDIRAAVFKSLPISIINKALSALPKLQTDYFSITNYEYDYNRSMGHIFRVNIQLEVEIYGYRLTMPATVMFSTKQGFKWEFKPNWNTLVSAMPAIQVGYVVLCNFEAVPEPDFDKKTFSIGCTVTFLQEEIRRIIKCKGRTTLNLQDKTMVSKSTTYLFDFIPIAHNDVFIDGGKGRMDIKDYIDPNMKAVFSLSKEMVIQANVHYGWGGDEEICSLESTEDISVLKVLNALSFSSKMVLHLKKNGVDFNTTGSGSLLGVANFSCGVRASVSPDRMFQIFENAQVTMDGEVNLNVFKAGVHIEASPFHADVSCYAKVKIPLPCGAELSGDLTGTIGFAALDKVDYNVLHAAIKGKLGAKGPRLEDCDFCFWDCSSGDDGGGGGGQTSGDPTKDATNAAKAAGAAKQASDAATSNAATASSAAAAAQSAAAAAPTGSQAAANATAASMATQDAAAAAQAAAARAADAAKEASAAAASAAASLAAAQAGDKQAVQAVASDAAAAQQAAEKAAQAQKESEKATAEAAAASAAAKAALSGKKPIPHTDTTGEDHDSPVIEPDPPIEGDNPPIDPKYYDKGGQVIIEKKKKEKKPVKEKKGVVVSAYEYSLPVGDGEVLALGFYRNKGMKLAAPVKLEELNTRSIDSIAPVEDLGSFRYVKGQKDDYIRAAFPVAIGPISRALPEITMLTSSAGGKNKTDTAAIEKKYTFNYTNSTIYDNMPTNWQFNDFKESPESGFVKLSIDEKPSTGPEQFLENLFNSTAFSKNALNFTDFHRGGDEEVEFGYSVNKLCVRLTDISNKENFFSLDRAKFHEVSNFNADCYAFFKPSRLPQVANSSHFNQLFLFKGGNKHETKLYAVAEKFCNDSKYGDVFMNAKDATAEYYLLNKYPTYWNGKKDNVDYLVTIPAGADQPVQALPVYSIKIDDLTIPSLAKPATPGQRYMDAMYSDYAKYNTRDVRLSKIELENCVEKTGLTKADIFNALVNIAPDKKTKRLFDFKILSNNRNWKYLKSTTGKSGLLEVFPWYASPTDPQSLVLGGFGSKNYHDETLEYKPGNDLSDGLQLFTGSPPSLNEQSFAANNISLFDYNYWLFKKYAESQLLLLDCEPGKLAFFINDSVLESRYYRYQVTGNNQNAQAQANYVFCNQRLDDTKNDKYYYADKVKMLKQKDQQQIAQLIDKQDGSMIYYELDEKGSIKKCYLETSDAVKIRWINSSGQMKEITAGRAQYNNNFKVFAQDGSYKLSGLPMKELKALIENRNKFMDRAKLIISAFVNWEKDKSRINPLALFRPAANK